MIGLGRWLRRGFEDGVGGDQSEMCVQCLCCCKGEIYYFACPTEFQHWTPWSGTYSWIFISFCATASSWMACLSVNLKCTNHGKSWKWFPDLHDMLLHTIEQNPHAHRAASNHKTINTPRSFCLCIVTQILLCGICATYLLSSWVRSIET